MGNKKHQNYLLPLCRKCHVKIEFNESGVKVTLPEARERLLALAANKTEWIGKVTKKLRKLKTKKAKPNHSPPNKPPQDFLIRRALGKEDPT